MGYAYLESEKLRNCQEFFGVSISFIEIHKIFKKVHILTYMYIGNCTDP